MPRHDLVIYNYGSINTIEKICQHKKHRCAGHSGSLL